MRRTRKLLAGALATVLGSSAAFAADPIIMPPPAPAAPVVIPAPAATWTGAYFGTFAAITFPTAGPPPWKNLGVVGGYDFQFNRIVAGLNVRTSVPSPFGAPLFIGWLDANLNGRAGFLISDRLLAYGTVGIGYTAPVITYRTIGAGVEFALNDTIHFFTEFTHANALGGPPIGNAIQFGLTLR